MRLAPSGQPQRSCLRVVRPTRPPQRPYRTAPRSSPGHAPTARPTTWRLPLPPRASTSRRRSRSRPARARSPRPRASIRRERPWLPGSSPTGPGRGSTRPWEAVAPSTRPARCPRRAPMHSTWRPQLRPTVPPSSSGTSRTARFKRLFAGRAQTLRHPRRSRGPIRRSSRGSPLSAPEPRSRHGGDGMAAGSASRLPCWRPARPASAPRRLSHPRTGTPSLRRSPAMPPASRRWLGG